MKFQERIFALKKRQKWKKAVHQEVKNISSSTSIGQISGLKRE
jgi:hypothetical protein